MIQRKQTLFLFLAALLLAICFMFPIASFKALAPLGVPVSGNLTLVAKDVPETMSQILNGEPVVMSQRGFVKTWPLVVGVVQMRVVAVGFLLSVLNVFLVFIWAVDAFVDKATAAMACTEVHVTYGVSTWAMIVAAVLLLLAQRSIKKDEEKVRAADRLR